MSTLKITVVDNESDLWAIEEPPEPVITIEHHRDEIWVVGDENAEHKDFEETVFPLPMYGDGVLAREAAQEYAKRWARAVRGVYEVN